MLEKIPLTSTRKVTKLLMVSYPNLIVRYNLMGNSPWCHFRPLAGEIHSHIYWNIFKIPKVKPNSFKKNFGTRRILFTCRKSHGQRHSAVEWKDGYMVHVVFYISFQSFAISPWGKIIHLEIDQLTLVHTFHLWNIRGELCNVSPVDRDGSKWTFI